MSIDCLQLKQYIILPALTAIGLNSENAVKLLLGTCAQESAMGNYLVQNKIGFNGACGIFQMEKAAYNSLYDSYITRSVSMSAKMKLYLGYNSKPPFERMCSDLSLATIMARLFYYAIKEDLPDPNDVNAIAQYYKKYWNTIKGKATIDEFISNYNKYVIC